MPPPLPPPEATDVQLAFALRLPPGPTAVNVQFAVPGDPETLWFDAIQPPTARAVFWFPQRPEQLHVRLVAFVVSVLTCTLVLTVGFVGLKTT